MPLKSPVLSSINKELNLAIEPSKDSLAKFISSSVASSLLNTSSALLISTVNPSLAPLWYSPTLNPSTDSSSKDLPWFINSPKFVLSTSGVSFTKAFIEASKSITIWFIWSWV